MMKILTQSVKLTLEKAFKVLLVAAQMKNCLKYFAEQYSILLEMTALILKNVIGFICIVFIRIIFCIMKCEYTNSELL